MPLTSAEQYLLELINRGRLDPLAEAERHDIDINAGLDAGQIGSDPLQVLAHNDTLAEASEAHSIWMLGVNTFAHAGAGGSSAGERMTHAGYEFEGNWQWAENLAWSGTTDIIDLDRAVSHHHQGLFLSAGHRANTFATDVREIGIAQVEGGYTLDGVHYNSSMLTENFALSGTDVFVTGVAYTDSDDDDFYSIGEGQSGVTISVGQAQDTTANAGGYAVQIAPQDAAVTVSTNAGQIAIVQMDLTGGNGKLDVVTDTSGDMSLHVSVDTTLISGINDATLLGRGDLGLRGNGVGNALTGNAGDNVLTGLGGRDVLDGAAGDDVLGGGRGRDRLLGGDGDDVLRGGGARDVLRGQTGDDNLNGGRGNDRLFGGDGDDALNGGSGRDRLNGQDGNDNMHAGRGRDVLHGGDGDDVINGGGGNDRLVGGHGADTFVFTDGHDDIRDYDAFADNIEISAQLLGDNTLADLMRVDGNDIVISFADGHSLTVDDYTDTAQLLENIIIA